MQILHNLTWDAEKKEWNNGEIYDTREGDTYSLFASLKDQNTFDLRGILDFHYLVKQPVGLEQTLNKKNKL